MVQTMCSETHPCRYTALRAPSREGNLVAIMVILQIMVQTIGGEVFSIMSLR